MRRKNSKFHFGLVGLGKSCTKGVRVVLFDPFRQSMGQGRSILTRVGSFDTGQFVCSYQGRSVRYRSVDQFSDPTKFFISHGPVRYIRIVGHPDIIQDEERRGAPRAAIFFNATLVKSFRLNERVKNINPPFF